MLEYASILILGALAAGVALFMLFANALFGPKNPNPVKAKPFECGVDPIALPAGRGVSTILRRAVDQVHSVGHDDPRVLRRDIFARSRCSSPSGPMTAARRGARR